MHPLAIPFKSWLALVALVFSANVLPALAADERQAQLDHIESLRTKDHGQFVRLLDKLHLAKPTTDARDNWHLFYLDTWELQFEGDYKTAAVRLKNLIDNADDDELVIKASALLLNNYAANRQYDEGFALANRLSAQLPEVKDRGSRYLLLMNLSTILNMAGETDLAVNYATLMESVIPEGENTCYPMYLRVSALTKAKRLTSSSPEIQRTIDTCAAGRQSIIANAMWLVLGDLYIDEEEPEKTLSILRNIGPSIRISQYYPHRLSSQTQLARALEKLGRDDEAKKAALSAVSMGKPTDASEWLATSYGILYRIAKKQGNEISALDYYERYVEQNKDNLNDIGARTMAYQLSQQVTLVRKLESETLAKQNSILRLQQALDAKAMETGRLYFALLLATLFSIGFWAYRTKRSQLRFQKISHRDGLTGIYHHQHFMAEAERCLRALQKRSATGCLVSIDLDHFKQVNDTHGHAVGDAVLRHAVLICKQQLRPHDLFGRLGGEEFGILLVDCPTAEGVFVADRIRMAIEASPLMEDGRMVTLSASVGVSCTGKSGYTLQKLCRDSDAALYRAKRTGRNRVVAHTEEGDQTIEGMPGNNLSNVTG